MSALLETWAAVAPSLAAWLATYAIHSTLLLGGAWLLAWRLGERAPSAQEAAWRVALIGGIVTATVQVGFGLQPLAGRFAFTRSAVSDVLSADLPAVISAAPTTAPPAAPSLGAELVLALLALWLIGAAGHGIALALSHLSLRALLRDRRPLLAGSLPAMLERLRAAWTGRPVRLSASGRIAIPLAAGVRTPEICVPERALELRAPEQEAMLAHELAHVVRRDAAWLLAARAVEGALFFQPLNRVARARLQELAELACDDWAAERTGSRRTLARCLAEVAGWAVGTAQPLPAPSMAGQESSLRRRIARLVAPGPRPAPRPGWVLPALGIAIAALIVIAPAVTHADPPAPPPAPAARPAPPAPPQPASPAEDHEIARLQEEIERLVNETKPSDEELREIEELAARAIPSAELEKLSQELAAGIGERMAVRSEDLERASRELSATIEAQVEREMALQHERLRKEHGRLSDEQRRHLEEQVRLSEEQRRALEERARALAERLRPSDEERARMREQAEALAQQMRLKQEDLARLREQARELAERARPSEQEQARLRELTERMRRALSERLAPPPPAPPEASAPAPRPAPEAPPAPPRPPDPPPPPDDAV